MLSGSSLAGPPSKVAERPTAKAAADLERVLAFFTAGSVFFGGVGGGGGGGGAVGALGALGIHISIFSWII